MRFFMTGLFGRNTVQSIWPIPGNTEDLQVLRFYKLCKRWKREVDKNPEAYEPRARLEDTDEWNYMTGNVSKRLGLEEEIGQGKHLRP